MNNYIYLYMDRIILVRPYIAQYKPATGIYGVRWFIVSSRFPADPNEMVAKRNYGFNFKQGYFEHQVPAPAPWPECENAIRHIEVKEKFNSYIVTQQLKIKDQLLGDAGDLLLIDELREFRRTGSIESCTILQTMVETADPPATAEAIATHAWLRYESYREVIAYLIRLEAKVAKLLKEEKYEQATQLVTVEYEKLVV